MGAVLGYLFGCLVMFLVLMFVVFNGAVKIGCVTDGATLNHTMYGGPDHNLYLKYYCVKDGKVVP